MLATSHWLHPFFPHKVGSYQGFLHVPQLLRLRNAHETGRILKSTRPQQLGQTPRLEKILRDSWQDYVLLGKTVAGPVWSMILGFHVFWIWMLNGGNLLGINQPEEKKDIVTRHDRHDRHDRCIYICESWGLQLALLKEQVQVDKSHETGLLKKHRGWEALNRLANIDTTFVESIS